VREQRALRALSVFHGGWSREAAWEVADVGMPLLLVLTDASFIRRDAAGRFVRHPLVAQYTRERADEDAVAREADRARHAEFFLRLIADRQDAWRTHEGARLLREIDDEMPNVEAAWRWAVLRRDETPLTAAMNGIRALMVTSSDKIGLLVELVRQPLEWAAPTSALHARALVCLGVAEVWRGTADVAEGAAHLAEALAVLEGLDLPDDVAQSCRFLGMARARQGRIDEARGHWERALRLSREIGDAEGVAMMLNNLSDTSPTFDDAISSYRRAIAFALDHDQPVPAAMALDGLGCTLFRRSGASDEVCTVIARSVELLERTGFHHVAQVKRILLAHALAASGRLQEACAAVDDALRRAPQDDDVARDRLDALAVAAWIAYLRGDAERAAAACDAVLLRSGDGIPQWREVLARTVAGRLALAVNDLERASTEFACARRRNASSGELESRAGAWHDLMAELPDAASRTRLIAAEIELAIADDRLVDAEALAEEALEIASRSEQEPSGAVALVVTAHVLDRRGDVEGARALVRFVRGHAATPCEALQAADRIEAEWPRPPDVETGRPSASMAGETTMATMLARARLRIGEP
jgi:tetratricopeptide (TPR) repeat protein